MTFKIIQRCEKISLLYSQIHHELNFIFECLFFIQTYPVRRQILTKENLTGSGLMAKLQSTIFFSEIKFLNIFTGGHKLISIANTPFKA